MSNATAFYDLVDTIKDTLLQDENVNKVTYGDITEVATEKSTTYPLAHMVVNNVVVRDNIFTFNLTVACMDIIDYTKNEVDNEMDIFNTQLAVVTRLILLLKRHNMRGSGFQLIGEPTTESFKHRFEDEVAGWDVTFDVNVIQDLNVC